MHSIPTDNVASIYSKQWHHPQSAKQFTKSGSAHTVRVIEPLVSKMIDYLK